MAPLARLAMRALGFSSTDSITCAKPMTDDVGEPLFDGSDLTLHQLMTYVSAGCLVLTVLSCVFLSWRHLHRYTAPQEQRQILRIVNLPIFYCVFNFLAICFYQDYFYIQPIAGIYEAFVVAALFLLMLEFICPDGTDREKYFENLEGRDKKGNFQPGGSLKWFNQSYSTIMQYPLSKTVFTVIEIVTQFFGVYCENSFSPKYAHLYLTILDYLFVGGAGGATIRFFRRFKKDFSPVHKVTAKVFSFLGILVFQILQDLIFHLLNGKLFSPSPKATYNDINFGIPSFLTCVESVIFSLIFHWAYSPSEYQEGTRLDRLGRGPAPRVATWRAILDALNLSDIVVGTVVAFQLLFMRVRTRYGARPAPQRTKTMMMEEDQQHLEPLSQRNNNGRVRAASAASDQYSPPLEMDTGYGRGSMGDADADADARAPALPRAARDPSPGAPNGRARTYRADELRPQMGRTGSYQRLGFARDPSPSDGPVQNPRPMF